MKTCIRRLSYALMALWLCSCATMGRVRIHAKAQEIPSKDGFQLISYELYKGRKFHLEKKPRAVFFYIQGSEYETVTSKIGFLASAVIFGSRAILMEKRGCYYDKVDTAICYRYADKSTRVQDHLSVVQHYLQQVDASVPVVLVGGSEGGDVAAAVAARCPRVNYLILIGSGGGWSQKTEFRHLVNKYPGYLGFQSVSELDQKLAEIAASSDGDAMWAGHPYRRWQSFLNDSSLVDLRQLSIPILLLQGEADSNVPCESARAVKARFDEWHKTNLRYIEYPGVDHQMNHVEDGKSRYPYLEVDMIDWFYQQGLASKLERDLFVRRVKRAHQDIF